MLQTVTAQRLITNRWCCSTCFRKPEDCRSASGTQCAKATECSNCSAGAPSGGLNFHLQPKHWPFNPGLADGVVIAITESGKNPDAFMQKAFAAIWEDQLDLADPPILAKLANEAGFDGEALVARAGSEAITAIYQGYKEEAKAAGVFGVPSYVLDGEVFWGQDRIELLADALESGRAPYLVAGGS